MCCGSKVVPAISGGGWWHGRVELENWPRTPSTSRTSQPKEHYCDSYRLLIILYYVKGGCRGKMGGGEGENIKIKAFYRSKIHFCEVLPKLLLKISI